MLENLRGTPQHIEYTLIFYQAIVFKRLMDQRNILFFSELTLIFLIIPIKEAQWLV